MNVIKYTKNNTMNVYLSAYTMDKHRLKLVQDDIETEISGMREELISNQYNLKNMMHVIDDIYVGSLYHLNCICNKLGIEDTSSVLLKEITDEYKDKHPSELIWLLEVQTSEEVFYIARKRKYGIKKSECIICQTKEKFINDVNRINKIIKRCRE